jgi:hypothetical protein
MSEKISKEKDSEEEKPESDVKEKMLKSSSEEIKTKRDSEEIKSKRVSEEGIELNAGSQEKKRIDPFKDNKRHKILKKIISHTCLLITVLGISFFFL